MVLTSAAFIALLVTFLAMKQNYNEVNIKLKLAEHILHFPEIPHLIKVIIAMSLSMYAFFFLS